MKRPYTYRTRSKLAPKIWAMKVGDIELFEGFAAGSVKSVVSRWVNRDKRNRRMVFRTKKSPAGIIVYRTNDKPRQYKRKGKRNDTTIAI